MTLGTPSIETLAALEPLGSLPSERLAELASFCQTELLAENGNPFNRACDVQSVYVLSGAVEVTYADGETEVVGAGGLGERRPLGKGREVVRARALSSTEVLRIDDDLVDIMVTWNQIESLGELAAAAGPLPSAHAILPPASTGWTQFSGVFSIDTLTSGVFASLPPAHIAELLKRFVPITVKRGDMIIREQDSGDYYYVIESGRARVTRFVGGAEMPLADLKSGDAFGEEALIVEGRRNATVTMKTDGRLLRLAKVDFDELLKRPLLAEIDFATAQARVAAGARWLDVRFPSEYQHDRIPGATNVPLGELRNALDVLDRSVEYVAYCQSGRRSAAAAFLLAQRGFRAAVLIGGLWSARSAG